MKTWKRILALLLCLSLLCGCAENRPGTESGPQETNPGTESSEDRSTEESTAQTTAPGPDQTVMPTADPSDGEIKEPEPVLVTEDHKDDFFSVRNADPSMTIPVLAPASYSREQVLAGIKFSNLSNPVLTNPEEKDLIDPDYLLAEGGNGEFTVSCVNGFNKGEVYQLELTDEALSYKDHDSTVRFFNLTTTAEEVNRIRLKPKVKLLDASALLSEEAEKALEFDGIFRYGSTPSNDGEVRKTGTFTGREDQFLTGDIVAIYTGTPPDDRSFADSSQNVAYVKIVGFTEGPGDQLYFHYVGAAQNEVIFTPDVIPVKEENLISRGADNTVTLPLEDVLFPANGIFAPMGLNENTEVEPGDFVAFYTGSEESGTVTGYAEVLDVSYESTENGPEAVKIAYKETDLDTIMASTDLYREFSLTEEQIMSAYDEEALRAGVIEEMKNNGFLIQSSWNLAQLAMETDEVKDYFGDTPLEDLTFCCGEDEAVTLSGKEYLEAGSGANDIGVDVKSDDPDVHITPNIVHFAGKTGYGYGVRMEIITKFYISIKDTADPKKELKITISFFHEAEIVYGFTVDATSVWKRWFIFPYVCDYIISGSIGSGIYVGSAISAQATLIKYTPEKTEEEKAAGLEWPEDVKKTPGSERVMKCADVIKNMGLKHDSLFPPQTTGGGTLQEKYKSFTKGSDKAWVDLINKNIFDFNGPLEPWHILAFRLKGDFVISGLLNAAAGVAGNYERAHRQVFSFSLFHEDTTTSQCDETNTSDLRADFYVFGAAGLRAGVRLSYAVGLFDCRLDSVGVEVEGGLYARFWGFFYAGMEAHNVGMEETTTDAYYEGGLLLETGLYYGITFFAQAGDGGISYRRFVKGGEFPLFSAGTDIVITDFTYIDGEKEIEAVYPVNVKTARIPDSVFLMKGMSLKNGTSVEVSRADRAAELYEITISDPDYSFRFENGAGYLYRNSDKSGTGLFTMTLRWRGSSFEQMSHDLVRKVNVFWIGNLVTMQFLNRDGSVFHAISKIAGEPIEKKDLPGRPASPGYRFLGWVAPDGTDLKEMPTVMPEADTVYTSKWEKGTVPVTVDYQEFEEYHGSGGGTPNRIHSRKTDTIKDLFYPGDKVENIVDILKEKHLLATEADYDFEGHLPLLYYEIDEEFSKLSCDAVSDTGSTVFEIRIKWAGNTVTFDDGAGNVTTKRFAPGRTIEFPSVTRQGYDFVGWQNEAGEMISMDNLPVSTKDETYTAVWQKIAPTFTLVFQIVKRGSGVMPRYYETVHTMTVTWDSYEVTVRQLLALYDMSGYTYNDTYSGRGIDDVVTISPDGTTVVNLRFI